jgi:tRNA-specific 2-thiouridylase
MSGGVDSSAAAALLLEQGYEVIGVTLQLQPCQETGDRRSCCCADGVVQARTVAGQLGIPHYVLDCQQEFAEKVLEPCWREYSRGRTPNPCVLCNERIKFGALLDFARSLGADCIATGHYARVDRRGGGASLNRGRDPRKDQSYFLFSLDAAQLGSALMPLGDLTKAEVRSQARQRGLVTADRRESQDICLSAPDAGFGEYLCRRFGGTRHPGEIVDSSGRVVGRHEGIHHFTIGQRRGAGVALGRPAWVKDIDTAAGRITLTTDEQELLSTGLTAVGLVWHTTLERGTSLACHVQTRYRQAPVPARVELQDEGRARVLFERRVRAVTPGQAVVFYHGDQVVGGGWIDGVLGRTDSASRVG